MKNNLYVIYSKEKRLLGGFPVLCVGCEVEGVDLY